MGKFVKKKTIPDSIPNTSNRNGKAKLYSDGEESKHESLILAQDERWRRA